SQGNSACSWNIISRSFPGPLTGSPSSRISPADGVSKPAIRLSSVDLPQPDGPNRTTYSPSRISRFTACNAATFCVALSNVLVTFASRSLTGGEMPGFEAGIASMRLDFRNTTLVRHRGQVPFLEDFVQRAQRKNPGQFRRLPEKANLVRGRRRLPQRSGHRVPGELYARHRLRDHGVGERLACLLLQFGVQDFSRGGRVGVDLPRHLDERAEQVFGERGIVCQELAIDDQHRRGIAALRPESLFVEKKFTAPIDLQTRQPRLDRPGAMNFPLLKQGQLIGIGQRQQRQRAAFLPQFIAALPEPDPRGDVLSVPQLRRGDDLTPEILLTSDARVLSHDQSRTAAGAPGDNHELFASRFDETIDRGTRPDECRVDGIAEHRLDRRGTGIERNPFDGHPDFPLEFALRPRVNRLSMSDVGKVAEPQLPRFPGG